MKFKTLAVLGLIVLTGLVGFATGWVVCRLDFYRPSALPATSPQSEQLRWVQHADVIADFRQHVEREHDTRFVTRYGLSFASEFFGPTETPEITQLIQKHGSRRLEAGDDITTSAEQEELQHQIGVYGTRYNNMLVGYLECQQ